jgi:uracil-DNA glycosylase
VALGKFAFDALIKNLKIRGHEIPKMSFAHGAQITYSHDGVKYLIICSYHPSQQNTFTGKLTKAMLDSVLEKAGRFAQLK